MEHDHMIEAFATNGANHPLDVGSPPRRARCRQDFANAHVSHVFSEVIAKDRIVVAQEVARELGKGNAQPLPWGDLYVRTERAGRAAGKRSLDDLAGNAR